MAALVARLVAVLLTVLPWATALIALPRIPKSESSLSSPASPNAQQLQNAPNVAPNAPSYTRDSALPVAVFTLKKHELPRDEARAPRVLRPDLGGKLYRTYSRWQLEGA
jgi:hypothetical protein